LGRKKAFGEVEQKKGSKAGRKKRMAVFTPYAPVVQTPVAQAIFNSMILQSIFGSWSVFAPNTSVQLA